MRAVRLVIAVLIVSPILMLAFSESRMSRQPFAQDRGTGTRATDCTRGSRSAAALRDDRNAADTRAGAGNFACGCDRGADAARISMHLFGAGNLDRVVGRGLVVELCSCEAVCARAVRQLLAERERAVAVHTTGGITLSQQRPTIYNGTAFTQHGQVATSVGQSFLLPRSEAVPLTTECTQCACN